MRCNGARTTRGWREGRAARSEVRSRGRQAQLIGPESKGERLRAVRFGRSASSPARRNQANHWHCPLICGSPSGGLPVCKQLRTPAWQQQTERPASPNSGLHGELDWRSQLRLGGLQQHPAFLARRAPVESRPAGNFGTSAEPYQIGPDGNGAPHDDSYVGLHRHYVGTVGRGDRDAGITAVWCIGKAPELLPGKFFSLLDKS
jgi:hypothetical protein